MKTKGIVSRLLVTAAFSFPLQAAELFIYIAPSGDRVVTDRPINLEGYELERNALNPESAGRSLRFQDTVRNRQLIDQYINNAAFLYDIDSHLIKAVIRQESAFRIDARSHKGAMGLMQLMPATARQYRVSDILDPKENIYAGTRHLKYLIGRYDNLSMALAAYNAGEGAVAKYQGIPPYRETQDYVVKVLNWYEHYKKNEG